MNEKPGPLFMYFKYSDPVYIEQSINNIYYIYVLIMANPVVIVFGSNGMLGNAVKQYFEKTTRFEVLAYSREEFEVSGDVVSKLHALSKDWLGGGGGNKERRKIFVVNAIGIIPQKVDATEYRSYMSVNAIFPHQLFHVCHSIGATLFHISTDCVYDGRAGSSYEEGAPHSETNIYGVSKSCGEPCGASVIRTSIIGEEEKGKKSLLEWVRSNKANEIRGFTNHFWNGVTVLQVAKVLEMLMIEGIEWKGVRHVISPESVSKEELVALINDVYSLNIRIVPFEAEHAMDKTLLPSQDVRFSSLHIPPLRLQLEQLRTFHTSSDPAGK